MPETNELPPIKLDLLNWARDYYKLRGWTFPETETTGSETGATNLESAPEPSAEEQIREISEQVQVEFTVQLIAGALEESDATQEELSELQVELQSQADGDTEENAQAAALIASQIKLTEKQIEAEEKLVPTSGLDDGTKQVLCDMLKLCGQKLKIADAQSRLGGYDVAQATLTEIEQDLADIRAARLAAQAAQNTPEPSAALKALAGKTKDAARALRQIEFTGPAKSLETKLKELSQEVAPEEHIYWGFLKDEVQKAEKATSVLTKTADRIRVIQNSLEKEGFEQWAQILKTELALVQSREGRSILGAVSDLNRLRSSAEDYETKAKAKEWTDEELADITAEVRKQFEAYVVLDDSGRIKTKDDKKQVEQKANTYRDLDHDVYVQIPKKGKKKVPRETMQAVLDSLEFLDELRASGVKGVGSIAKQELEKAQGILAGMENNASEYGKLKKKLADLADKLEELGTSDKTAGYYIEERLSLAEDVSKLSSGYSTMPIDAAKAEFTKLSRQEFAMLNIKIKEAAQIRKDFDAKSADLGKKFVGIAALLTGDLTSKIIAGLPSPKVPFFEHFVKSKGAGPLRIEHETLVDLAANALTKEEVMDAREKLIALDEKVTLQLVTLERLKKVRQTADLNYDQQMALDSIASDYRQDRENRQQSKERAKKFAEEAKPLKDELDAMLRSKHSLKRAFDHFKGHSRVDPETFDLTRIREIRDELTVLEKKSVTSDEFTENMARLSSLKQSMDFIRSELSGFRDDLAQGLETYTERCIGTLKDAADFARNDFADQVEALEGDDTSSVIDKPALQRFLKTVSSQLVLDGLVAQAAIIADRNEDLAKRKAARELALRQVRPLLAQIRGNAAIQHYLNQPFNLPTKLHFAVNELAQLEVRLLQLAS